MLLPPSGCEIPGAERHREPGAESVLRRGARLECLPDAARALEAVLVLRLSGTLGAAQQLAVLRVVQMAHQDRGAIDRLLLGELEQAVDHRVAREVVLDELR